MYKILANSRFAAKSIVYLPSCHSTNDIALLMASQNTLNDGDVVITDEQTHGKGQRGTSWESEPFKNLIFTFYIKPTFLDIKDQFYLTMAVSLGIVDALKGLSIPSIKIKWPNDIYSGDKKIAGILIENNLVYKKTISTAIGIGLNVNQRKFIEEKATSMCVVSESEFDRNLVFENIILSIEDRYLQLQKAEYDTLSQDYHDLLYLKDQTRWFVRNGIPFDGTITGVDSIGRLLIESSGQNLAFHNKEVEFMR